MAPPSYDLAIQGFLAFTRVSLSIAQRKMARDPLSGLVNGSNKVFYTTLFPLLSSGSTPLIVYDGVNSVVGAADFDTGEITLNNVPTNQPLATYTFTPYTGQQVIRFLVSGLDEMESRWPRGYTLVDALGNPANETSAQLLISDGQGQDPQITGNLTFSQSRVQPALLIACADYAYNVSVLGEAARTDHLVREGIRGMTIDKSKRPANMEVALERLNAKVEDILFSAQREQMGSAAYGGFIASPLTLDYIYNMEWQTSSKMLDTRVQAGFHVASRVFN
jgi:hypothetical protein